MNFQQLISLIEEGVKEDIYKNIILKDVWKAHHYVTRLLRQNRPVPEELIDLFAKSHHADVIFNFVRNLVILDRPIPSKILDVADDSVIMMIAGYLLKNQQPFSDQLIKIIKNKKLVQRVFDHANMHDYKISDSLFNKLTGLS